MYSPTPVWANLYSYTNRALHYYHDETLTILCFLFVVTNYALTVYLTEKSYAVSDTIETAISNEMLEIAKSRKADETLQILQAFSGKQVEQDYHFRITLTHIHGKNCSVVKASYREYAGGEVQTLARPAYSFNLEYDLDESKSMTFCSLEMGVIEATNALITFVIVDDGGLPWLSATI